MSNIPIKKRACHASETLLSQSTFFMSLNHLGLFSSAPQPYSPRTRLRIPWFWAAARIRCILACYQFGVSSQTIPGSKDGKFSSAWAQIPRGWVQLICVMGVKEPEAGLLTCILEWISSSATVPRRSRTIPAFTAGAAMIESGHGWTSW